MESENSSSTSSSSSHIPASSSSHNSSSSSNAHEKGDFGTFEFLYFFTSPCKFYSMYFRKIMLFVSSFLAIGIDLGTTNSRVGVYRNGSFEIIGNIPSYISFTGERFVGKLAKEKMDSNATNTIFNLNRLIGRLFDDPIVQHDIKYWPFNVKNVDSNPKVEIQYKHEKRVFFPEVILAMLLMEMKEMAEVYLGNIVTHAVITVPAHFKQLQRQAIQIAGYIAGLDVLRIMNGPTAAALAFGLETKSITKRNVLIFDLGKYRYDLKFI